MTHLSTILYFKRGLFFLFLAMLLSCNKSTDAIPTISIQSITPSGEKSLLTGQEITFDVRVISHHAKKGSGFGLIVQDTENKSLGFAGPVPFRDDGTGELDIKVKIATTRTVQVLVALFEDSNKSSVALDSRNYKVIGVKSN